MDTVVGENDTASATMVLARIKWTATMSTERIDRDSQMAIKWQ